MAALKRLPSYAQNLDAAATALETRAHRLIMYRKLRIKTLAPKPANAVTTESSPEASTGVTTSNATVTTAEEAANCSIDNLTSGYKVNQTEVKADEIYKLKMINDAILKQASITLNAAVKGSPWDGNASLTGHPGFVKTDSSANNGNYLGALGTTDKLSETTADIKIFDTPTKRVDAKQRRKAPTGTQSPVQKWRVLFAMH
uniref:Variant surface glycoprotein n=1 Tax=Trypanosoma brucei TaxID=5691 RepID=A0A1V0FYL5_9TRYP|nr:variant surface glycoprotein [Trypanosoma brucei]